jgi:hypothetical protein
MVRRFFMILIIIFVTPINAMDLNQSLVCSMSLLTQDVARNRIQSLLSFQEISRLKRSSKECNALYDLERVCPLFREHTCSTHACAQLAKNYYTCTKALGHFARKKDEEMFKHVWIHHEAVRNKNVLTLLKKNSEASLKNKMNVYSKYYDKAKKIRKHILEYGAQAICNNNDPDGATIVLSGGSFDIFDLLKKASSQLCYDAYFLFFKACQFEDVNLIKALCGGVVDVQSIEYIMRYAEVGLMVDLLCDDVLPVDCVNKSGKSLLHYAAEYGQYHVIEILIDKGVYVNSIDAKGMTPLHYAVKNIQYDAVVMLLDNKDADVRFANKKGKTALDYTTIRGVKLLNPEEFDGIKAIREVLKAHIKQHTVDAYSYSKVHKNGYQKLHI